MTTEVTPQDYELNVRITGTREQAEAYASAITSEGLTLGASVLVQPVQDSDEQPDLTTLLVPTEALEDVRTHVTVMTANDPYSEEYETSLAKLLPALHALLGITTETTPESVEAATPAVDEKLEVNW